VCKALAIDSAALRQWTGIVTEPVAVAPSDFVALPNPATTLSAHQLTTEQRQFTITSPNGVQVSIQGEHALLEVLSAASATDVAP